MIQGRKHSIAQKCRPLLVVLLAAAGAVSGGCGTANQEASYYMPPASDQTDGCGEGAQSIGPIRVETPAAGSSIKSSKYRMVHTLGLPIQHHWEPKSSSYRLQASIAGANGSEK